MVYAGRMDKHVRPDYPAHETTHLDDDETIFPNGALAQIRVDAGPMMGIGVGGFPFRVGHRVMAALAQAQQAATTVNFDSINKHHNYGYASGATIADAARRCLKECGLSIVRHGWRVVPTLPDGAGLMCIAVYQVYHSSGECLPAHETQIAICPGPGRPEDKATAAALSMAQKYEIQGVLNLAWKEDDDGQRGRPAKSRGGRDEPRETQRAATRPAQGQGAPRPQPQRTHPQTPAAQPHVAGRVRTVANPRYEKRQQAARAAIQSAPFDSEVALRGATGLEPSQLPGGTYSSSILQSIVDYCWAASIQDENQDKVDSHDAFLFWLQSSNANALWTHGRISAHGSALDKTEPPTIPA